MKNDRSESLNPLEAREILAFYTELGLTETLNEQPKNRFEKKIEKVFETNLRELNAKQLDPELIPKSSALQVATAMANKAVTIAQLEASLATFEFCDLRKGARNLVFADGNPKAQVMIIGDAPNPLEDRSGKPFVGEEGDMLDKMFSAIGLSRHSERSDSIYISTVIPWKPLHTQSSIEKEIEILLPFIKKHIQLVDPKFLIFMGSDSSNALFHRLGGNAKLENWGTFMNIQAVKIHHPKYLIKNPAAKKEAWKELLSLKDKLHEI